jgi:hypothetical protein
MPTNLPATIDVNILSLFEKIKDLLQIKSSRSPAELGLYRAFLTKESQIVLDSKMLS